MIQAWGPRLITEVCASDVGQLAEQVIRSEETGTIVQTHVGERPGSRRLEQVVRGATPAWTMLWTAT